jgi:hypothetical protein
MITRADIRRFMRARAATSPRTDRPCHVRPVDVAVHACRHLAYLRYTDDLIAACAEAAPNLWDHLGRFTPAVAASIGYQEAAYM